MKQAWKVCALLTMGVIAYANLSEVQASSVAVGSIRGFIKDGQGNPLIGASVLVLTELAETKDARVIKKASTDKEGKFVAAGLIPGRYRVKAEALGFTPIEFPADVQPRKVIVFDEIQLRRTGTLAEKSALNPDSKYAARRARGSIFHLDEEKPKATTEEPVILSPRASELHGYVQAFTQTAASEETDIGSMTGANFAVTQQLGKDASLVMSGQVAQGEGAMQRFEALTTGHAGDKHRLGLALGYARFTFSRHSSRSHLGQFSLSATDTWQVAGPVLVVYGFEFARFTEGASRTSVLPRFGISVDAGARTRLFGGLTPGASEDEQAKVNLESGEILFSQPKTVAFGSDGAPLMDSSYRLQFGAERLLDDHSSIEMMAFVDTVSGHGVGLLAIPIESPTSGQLGDPTFLTRQQKGRTQGMRVVYKRQLTDAIDGSIGYSYGIGQRLHEAGITEPARLFANGTFHVVSAKVNANFVKTGTRMATVLRLSPSRAMFAIDPFQGQMATYDPNISITLTQDLPSFGFIPGHLQALVDVRNLLDQQLSVADEMQELVASRFNRLLRVGVSLRF